MAARVRRSKVIASFLLLLTVSGARIVEVREPCDQCRSYFTPSLGFKALAKTALGKEWGGRGPRVASRHHHATHDLTGMRMNAAATPVAPAVLVRLEPAEAEAAMLDARPPSNVDPAHSPQSLSKK